MSEREKKRGNERENVTRKKANRSGPVAVAQVGGKDDVRR